MKRTQSGSWSVPAEESGRQQIPGLSTVKGDSSTPAAAVPAASAAAATAAVADLGPITSATTGGSDARFVRVMTRYGSQAYATPVQSVQQAPSQGRVYAFVPWDHRASGTLMEGTFLVNSFPVRILFDYRASHSFIPHSITRRLHLSLKVLDIPLSVATPLGDFSLLELYL